MPYLAELTSQITQAAARLPEPDRNRHVAFLRNAQQPDGGFSGRAGGSDVYYTSFALRGLFVLDALDGRVARQAGAFLAAQAGRPQNAVDLFAWLSSSRLVKAAGGNDCLAETGMEPVSLVRQVLEPLCCPDGGVAKSTRSGASSTYHTFLAALCRESVGLPTENWDAIVSMLRARQREDGGFVELPVMRQSGVNPTAAAIALLRMGNALDESLRNTAGRYLIGMQTPSGGLQAHASVPAADLLSTFTGFLALADLGRSDALNLTAVRRFVEALAAPHGGYLAVAQDNCPDVEYTFYGIAASALLAE